MDLHYVLTVIVPAIIVVLIAFVVERVLMRMISRFSKKHELSPSYGFRMKAMVRWLLGLVVVVIVSGVFGIGIANIWVTISALAVTILVAFFAMWSILSNLFSFLIIVLTRQFDIGDYVTILPENISGEVVAVSVFHTKLQTEDGARIYVPNVTFPTKFTMVSRRNRDSEDGGGI